MNTEIKHTLKHGFTIEGVVTKAVFTPEDAQETVRKFHHLEALGEDAKTFHYYSSKFLENVEDTRQLYLALGHKIKLHSKIPACVLRYSTHQRPDNQVYRIHNGIYFKGRSTFDITAPYKLRDLMNMEVKTIFNVSYRLDLDDVDNPAMRRVENQDTRRVEETVETIMSTGHHAFITQALNNLFTLEPGKLYQGRFFTLSYKKLANETGFQIRLSGNKPGSDSATFEYCNGQFSAFLIQPVQCVPMEVDRQMLFEFLYCIYREVGFSQGPKGLREKRQGHPRRNS